MKNNLINKFMFTFVIGISLLFSLSSAEIAVNTNYPNAGGQIASQGSKHGLSVLTNYQTDPTNESYKLALREYLDSLTQDYILYVDNSGYYTLATYEYGEPCIVFWSNQYLPGMVNSPAPSSSKFCGSVKSGYSVYTQDFYQGTSVTNVFFRYRRISEIVESNVDLPLLVDNGGNSTWDGKTYYYKAAIEPEGPDYSSDLVGLISSITSSDVIKDNTDSWNTDYFIIPFGNLSGRNLYEIYFYHKDVNLSAFEYLANDENYYYDLDKVSVDGVVTSIIDFFGTKIVDSGFIRGGNKFTVLYNAEDCSIEVSYDGAYYLDDLVGFSSHNNPIIFTTKNIPYYYCEKNVTTGEWSATADEDKNIINKVITDSNGNEISPVVSGTESFISNTPWERLVNIIQMFPEKITSAFSSMTGLTKVITYISPLTSAILIILNVLLSSISFLARAVAFVYTLPTIKASDALFLVDVDSTTGLVFTGNSWGVKFLEGLNMVKEFSWNGLNLWTLFTSFIVAIFAIHCVKLVRKHYHY